MTGRQLLPKVFAAALGCIVLAAPSVAADKATAVLKNPDGKEVGTVTLTAVPGSGKRLRGWSGDLSGSANPETITMDGNKSVRARFGKQR